MPQNWLDRYFPKATDRPHQANLPALDLWAGGPLNMQKPLKPGQLPNATLIYGVASATLLGVVLYFLFTGMWLTGLLVLLPAAVLLGYALHFLHYPS